MGYPAREADCGNCEREGRPSLEAGERSLWIPARLGEPFRVTLREADGAEIPSPQYQIEIEEKPGLFGTHYDYFRVTNISGGRWDGVRFLAEVIE